MMEHIDYLGQLFFFMAHCSLKELQWSPYIWNINNHFNFTERQILIMIGKIGFYKMWSQIPG